MDGNPTLPFGKHKADWIFLVFLLLTVCYQTLAFNFVHHVYPRFGYPVEDIFVGLSRNLYERGVFADNFRSMYEQSIFSENDLSNKSAPDPASDKKIQYNTWRTPSYPIYVSGIYTLFGDQEINAIIFNNGILFLSVILTFFMGRLIHPVAGLLVAMLTMADPIYIQTSNTFLADEAFHFHIVLFLLAAIWMFKHGVTTGRVALCAVFLVLQEYVRPSGMYLWIVFCLSLIFHLWNQVPRLQIAKLVLLFLAIHFAGIGIWTLRNVMVGGSADFVGMQGSHLVRFHMPLVIAERDGISESQAGEKLFAPLNSRLAHMKTTRERDDYLGQVGREMILENYRFSLLVMIKTMLPRLFFSPPPEHPPVFTALDHYQKLQDYLLAQEDVTSRMERNRNVIAYLFQHKHWVVLYQLFMAKLVNPLLILCALLGFWHMIRGTEHNFRTIGWFLFLFWGQMTLLHLIYALARYRMPIMPAVYLLAVFFVIQTAQKWRKNKMSHHP
ncbi:MAG: glycosyltransferase family 39 protein [Magnetococcus sp. DMHC-1]|nr:hypothetical protein [Magnetococcales bacterium]